MKMPHRSPPGKRKLAESPAATSLKKRRVSVEDADEKLKIEEGADALLNLAGISRESTSRSISPVSPPSNNNKTNHNNNIEVKSET